MRKTLTRLPLLTVYLACSIALFLIADLLPRTLIGGALCVLPAAILVSVPMGVTAIVTRSRKVTSEVIE